MIEVKYQIEIQYQYDCENYRPPRLYSKKGLKSLFSNKYSWLQSYLKKSSFYKVKIIMVRIEDIQKFDDISEI